MSGTVLASRGRDRMPLLTVLGTALVAGGAATLLDWRLLVPLGLGLPLVMLAVLSPPVSATAPVPHTASRPAIPAAGHARRAPWPTLHSDTWLAASWAVLFFGTEFLFLTGPRSAELAARGNISADNMVEMLSYVPALLVVGSSVLDGWPGRVPRLAQLFGLYAVLALLSVTWSGVPLLSAGRAFQFTVLAAFVAYCACRAVDDPELVDRLLVRVFRYIAFGVAALAVYGVLDGNLALDRFTWRGQHPNGAAGIMLVPCLALLFHPRRSTITRPLPWWVIPVGLLPLIYATGSRANVAGAGVALGVAWVIAATRDSRLGGTGLGALLIGLGSAFGYASDAVAGWILRDQSVETVTGLNGRIELWELALANPLGSEVWGVGVGAARGAWASLDWDPNHVHSAWIDILQTLGVLGLAVMGAVVVSLLVLVVAQRSVQGAWLATLATMASLTSVTIAQSSYSLIVLCLALMVVAGARSTTPDGTVPDLADQGVPRDR